MATPEGFRKAYVKSDVEDGYGDGNEWLTGPEEPEFYIAHFPHASNYEEWHMDKDSAYQSVNKYNAAWGDEEAAAKLR